MRLRQLHCEFAQSYMFAPPLTAEAARRRLQERQTAFERAG